MARHADFGAVASITEQLTNEVLSTVANNVPNVPTLSFNVPAINVGGNTASISGSLKLLAPTVSLHQRPDNLVTATLSLQGNLALASCWVFRCRSMPWRRSASTADHRGSRRCA